MIAAPTESAAASQSDPNRAGSGAPIPSRTGRLLALVRRLIEYGQDLTAALQQSPSGRGLVAVTSRFGTLDLAVIIARITCGLRRAVALEAKLNRCAARGHDVAIVPVRLRSAPSGKLRTQPAGRPQEQTPDGLPTVEQIAAEVRRKPIGAVIADICCDLGLMPGDMGPTLYREVFDAITCYGGRIARFFRDKRKLLCRPPVPPRDRGGI